MNMLEEGDRLQLDFGKLAKAAACGHGLVPVAVQSVDTGEVILVAYTNDKAFRLSMETRTAVFWSTSRNELWIKGKTSGNTFELVETYVNCEQNSLLYKVRPRVDGICHTKNKGGKPRNCYYRRIKPGTLTLENVDP